ncbi:PREDICTED: protein argonaute 2 [Theobroma cacao]|uniref:Protein argonaute 2 n=1 Tax=Theobroma cacao TaxID=3641 RepID=A0AB32WFL3_THECC|nr:PREDICTED: protein argonaute 2 [Theobroma cacao]
MERGGFRGRGRGYGVAGGRGRGRGRDGQRHHQQQPQEQQGRGSNQGRSRGPVSPIQGGVQQGHAHVVPSPGGRTSWGAGPSFAQVLSRETQISSSPANVVSGPVVPAMASLKISERVLPSSSSSSPQTKQILPVKRPDNGGTHAIKKLNLRANHFAVKFDPKKIIWHYDVDVKPKVAPGNGHPVKLSKSDLYLIRRQMSLDIQVPLEMTAYDGKKSIFSAVVLPTGNFTVQLSESSYLVTLKLVSELRLSQLNDYLSGKVLLAPRNILQGMDLVMKESMNSFSHGFHPIEFHRGDDLGHGIIASREPKHSLKLTSQVAFCLDYLVLPVRKSVLVIEYLGEQIDGFHIDKFGSFKDKVESELTGLRVCKTHLDTNRKYLIAGLTSKDAQNISFPIGDQQVRLVDYFKEKYKKDIVYKNIPCLELGKKNGSHCVPMELCVLAEGQKYPKELLDRDAAKKLKNISLALPEVREKTICNMVRARDGPCCGEVVQNFGMEVSMNMTKVAGRVLSPPELNVGAPAGRKMKIKVDNEKCHWNLVRKCVFEGKQIDRWAVLDFSSAKPNQPFIQKLTNRCNNLGIRMGEPLHYQMARMDYLNDKDFLQEMLEHIQRLSYERGKGRLQFLLCVMSKQHPGYNFLKFISETKVGVMTQCCLSAGANEAKDQYLANLALKINAKLGGLNVEIIEPLLHFKGEGHVMFVGADVNHPGFKNSTSPSIAAVVASMSWPVPNRYAAKIRPQDPRSEKIQDFGEMCLELIDSYVTLNKVKPAKIMIFRDGVSETQFDMVLNEELVGVKGAFQAMNYFPTITVIVAQKRHHTRFFLETKEDGGSSGNVPPGTVIDSTVVDPSGFHFHLFSQYGSIGTSKSTQYQVLWDEHRFSSDHIQQLIHSMCFTFALCTKPVYLIPPVYYADLAAYRGRLYQDALDRKSQASSRRSSSSSSLPASPSQPSAAAFNKSSYRVHPDLENSMFFI